MRRAYVLLLVFTVCLFTQSIAPGRAQATDPVHAESSKVLARPHPFKQELNSKKSFSMQWRGLRIYALSDNSQNAGNSIFTPYSSAIRDVEGSGFRTASKIDWNVNKKATLSLGLRRLATQQNKAAQGIIVTQARLQLNYEFLHNLFYKAYLDYSFADFQTVTRKDEIIGAGTGLHFNVNPKLSLSADYDFKGRDSSVLGLNYDRHEFLVRLNTRF